MKEENQERVGSSKTTSTYCKMNRHTIISLELNIKQDPSLLQSWVTRDVLECVDVYTIFYSLDHDTIFQDSQQSSPVQTRRVP